MYSGMSGIRIGGRVTLGLVLSNGRDQGKLQGSNHIKDICIQL